MDDNVETGTTKAAGRTIMTWEEWAVAGGCDVAAGARSLRRSAACAGRWEMMTMHLRAGMAGYQYAGVGIEDALARHEQGKRPPVQVIVISLQHPEVPEQINGLPVWRGRLAPGTVYLVTDMGSAPAREPEQPALELG